MRYYCSYSPSADVDRLQQIADRKQVTQEDEEKLTEDWKEKIISSEKYKAYKNEFPLLLIGV